MMKRGLIFVLALVAPVAAKEPSAADEAKAVERLVAKLGSRSFREREEAMGELARRSPAAVVASLRKAANSVDPEMRRRAADLLTHAERRIESERVLRPQKIHLAYTDLPLAQAVADFTRRTGLPIQMNDAEKAKLSEKKVTLDTGEVSLWEALDKLCAAAGLEEMAATNPYEGRYYDEDVRWRRRKVMWMDQSSMPRAQPVQVMLQERKGSPRPTAFAGAFRVQVPSFKSAPGNTTPDNLSREMRVPLVVDHEPTLNWGRLLHVRIDKAIDGDGRKLEQISEAGPTGQSQYQAEEVFIMGWEGRTAYTPQGGPRHGSVRLKLPEKPSKSIKELQGVLTAEVEGPAETLVAVDNILKAADRTVTGPDGSHVKVIEVTRDEGGGFKIKVEVKAPTRPNDPLAAANIQFMQIGRGAEQATVDLSPADAASRGLSLVDADGRPLLLVTAHSTRSDAPNAPLTYTLHYRPQKGQGDPAKFVLTGRRTVVVEAPFAFKNVSLE